MSKTDIHIVEEFNETEVNPEQIAQYLNAEFFEDKTTDKLRYRLYFKENDQTRIQLYFSKDKNTICALSGLQRGKYDTFVTFSYITKVLFQTFKIVSETKDKQEVKKRKAITIFAKNKIYLMITDQFMLSVTGPVAEEECFA